MAWYKGLVKTIMGEMKNVPNEKKKEAGQLLNEFKQFTEAKYGTETVGTRLLSGAKRNNSE